MKFLDYEFANEDLLTEALTTPSYRTTCPTARDNQRLEFLGDAILGLLAAEHLYAESPDEKEGAMTIRRARMVSTEALCAAAARVNLVPSLRRNRGAPPLSPRAKTIADAVEALLGAAYLDGGLPAARQIFKALALSPEGRSAVGSDNPKGELQMRSQAMQPPRLPVYTLLSWTGRSHDPVFTVKVTLEGVGEAEAKARSHKEAEVLAAAKLLEDMV